MAHSEEHGLDLTRSILSTLQTCESTERAGSTWREPLGDPEKLRGEPHTLARKRDYMAVRAAALRCIGNAGAVPADLRQSWDVRAVLAHILDASKFQEFKALFGTSLVTGFGQLHGQLIGTLANNGVLQPDSALKGEFCLLH